MDKKKKMWLVPAACFVLVSGVVALSISCGGQEKGQIVLEKQAKAEQTPETEEGSALCRTEAPTSEIAEEQTERIYVHVCGAVVTEGVYSLPSGSRVIDGITIAGGFCETADTAYHNLAACLTDGQKVYVPTLEETRELSAAERMEHAGASAGGRTASAQGNAKVNINTAGPAELMTLSGIGEAKAESILQYREKVGPFQSIEELKNVSGIGEAMFERVKNEIVAE